MAEAFAVRFRVPEQAQDAWEQLAAAAGSSNDVRRVLPALLALWRLNPSDPRALDEWLSNLGIDKEDASSRQRIGNAKREFESYQRAKQRETERLIRGIATGPQAREFFLAADLLQLPFAAKELIYLTALSVAKEANLVFVLASLSRENEAFISPIVHELKPSAIAENFVVYFRSRSKQTTVTIPRATDPSRRQVDTNLIFRLTSLPFSECNQNLRALSESDRSSLISQIESLFPLLPEDRYGGALRKQIAFFMCVASPQSRIADQVISIVTDTNEPPDPELLGFVGANRGIALLSALDEKADPKQGPAMAAVLDSIRRHHPTALLSLPAGVLQRSQASRNPTLSLSAVAAQYKSSKIDELQFRRHFMRTLKADKSGEAGRWLTINPEFLDMIPLKNIPGRLLSGIFETLAKREPAKLIAFLRRSLDPDRRPHGKALWTVALQALSRIGSSAADDLFIQIVLDHSRGPAELQSLQLAEEPFLSLLGANVWAIAGGIKDERSWAVLFDAASSQISKDSILAWLEKASGSDSALRQWVLRWLVPRLLERGKLQPNFISGLTDQMSQAAVLSAACHRALEHMKTLKTIAAGWPEARDREKRRLANLINRGLNIAIHNRQESQPLERHFTELRQAVEQWCSSQQPEIDPAAVSISELALPESQPPSLSALSALFASRAPGPHAICLFLSSNDWASALLVETPAGPWPTLELLFTQVLNSLVFIARVRYDAESAIRDLPETVKVDLSMVLRDRLEEIEEQLAGYFAFRDVLKDAGLDPVEPILGGEVDQGSISSDKHKVFRDPSQEGRLRIFSLGLRVGKRVVGSARLMKSGVKDDRN